MSDHHDPHAGLCSEQAAHDLAWLEGHKPGPGRAGRSARAFALPTWRNGT